MGYSPWGRKDLDTNERIALSLTLKESGFLFWVRVLLSLLDGEFSKNTGVCLLHLTGDLSRDGLCLFHQTCDSSPRLGLCLPT